ncbi:alpha/beta hydrolase [soil metagenome]
MLHPPISSSVIPDVVYGRKFGMALTLDIVKPEKPSGVGVLALSSGGWRSWPEMGKPETAEFLKRGQTVFVVSHGAKPKFGIPEITHDILRAVRFVRARAHEHAVDPRRLGLFGISSGGNISLLAAAQGGSGNAGSPDSVDRQEDRIGAVACFYPRTDFRNFGEPGKIWIPYRPAEEKGDDTGLAEAYSPVAHFTAAMPPVLIIHGEADAQVPIQQGREAIARLDELGVEHRFEVRPGKGHGWGDMTDDYALCAEWFEKRSPVC